MNDVEGPPVLSSSSSSSSQQDQQPAQKHLQFPRPITPAHSQTAVLHPSGQDRTVEFEHRGRLEEGDLSDLISPWSGGWRNRGPTIDTERRCAPKALRPETMYERGYPTDSRDNRQRDSSDTVQTFGSRDSQVFSTSHLCNYREQPTARFVSNSAHGNTSQTAAASPVPPTKMSSLDTCTTNNNTGGSDSQLRGSGIAETRSSSHTKEPACSESLVLPPLSSSSLYASTPRVSDREQAETSWSGSTGCQDRASTSSRSTGPSTAVGALDLTVRPALSPRLWSAVDGEKTDVSAPLEVSHDCPDCTYTASSVQQLAMHFNRQHAVQGRCVCNCGQSYSWLPDLLKHRNQCSVYRQATNNHPAVMDRKRCSAALQNGDVQTFGDEILADRMTSPSGRQDDQLFRHKAKRFSQCTRAPSVDWSSNIPMKHLSCQHCQRTGFSSVNDYLEHCNQCDMGKLKGPTFFQTSSVCTEVESGGPNEKGNFLIPSKQVCSRTTWQGSDVGFNDSLRSTNAVLGPAPVVYDAKRSNRFTGVNIPPPLGLNTLMKSAGYPVQTYNYHHSVSSSSCSSEQNKTSTSHTAPSRVSEFNSSTIEMRIDSQAQNSAVLNTSSSAISITNGTDLTRPFKCCHCIKAFKSKALLDQHMHIHYPPKYTCRYCAKKYRWPPVFYHHQRACKKRPLTTTCTTTAPTTSITNSRELSACSHLGNNNNIISMPNSGRHHWSHNVGGLPTANYSHPAVTDLSFTFSPASSICFPPLGVPGNGVNSSMLDSNKHHGSPTIAPSLSSSSSSVGSFTMPVSSSAGLPLPSYFSLPPFHLGLDPFSTPTTSTVLPPPSLSAVDLLHNSLLSHLPGNPASPINWAALTAAAAATAAMSGLRLPFPPGALPNPLMLGHLPPPPLGFYTNGLHLPPATTLYNPCFSSSQSHHEDQSLNPFHGSTPPVSLPDWLPMLGNISHSPMDFMNLPSSLMPSTSVNKTGIVATNALNPTAPPPPPLQPPPTISCSSSAVPSVSLPQLFANLSNASGTTGHLTCVCSQRFSEMSIYMAHISTCPLFHHILLTSATCLNNNNNNSTSTSNPEPMSTSGPVKNHRVFGDFQANLVKHDDHGLIRTEQSARLSHEVSRNTLLPHADKVTTTLGKAMISDQVVCQSSGKPVELSETNVDSHTSTPVSPFAHLWKNNFPLNELTSLKSEYQSTGKIHKSGVKKEKTESVAVDTITITRHNTTGSKDTEGRAPFEKLDSLQTGWKHREAQVDKQGDQRDDIDDSKAGMSPLKHIAKLNSEIQDELFGQLSEQQLRHVQSLPFWLPPYMKSLLPQTEVSSPSFGDPTKSDDVNQPNPTSSLMAAMASVLANAAAAAGFQYPSMAEQGPPPVGPQQLSQQTSDNLPTVEEDLGTCPASPAPSSSSATVGGNGATTPAARLCQLCGKEFSSRLSLKQHVEGKHSAEGKYQCPGCAKRYRWGASYYYHKKSCPAVRDCTPPSSVQTAGDFCLPLGLLATPDDSAPPTPFPSPTQAPACLSLPSMMSSFMAGARAVTPVRFGGSNQSTMSRDQDGLFDLSQRRHTGGQETMEQASSGDADVEMGRVLKTSRSSSSEPSLQGSSPSGQVSGAHDFLGYQSTPDKAFKLIDAYVKEEHPTLH